MNLSQKHPRGNSATQGFTLVELVVVIAALGVLSAYAAMTTVSPAEMSLPSQAQTLASDIRRVQTLAYTSGNRMRLSITPGTNGTYTALSCVIVNGDTYCGGVQHVLDAEWKSSCVVVNGTTLCSCATVSGVTSCPASSFSVTLQKGVTLAGTSILDFGSDGQPSASASYTLTYGGSTKTVAVTALTGLVAVTP